MSRKMSWLNALVIALVAFIAYQPALKIGFLDGWWYLDWVSHMDLSRYLIQFFDPRNVTQGYRPVQGMYILVQYSFFQFNPDGYHLAHTLLHAANSVFLFLIVARLGKNSRVALIAALFYTASPVFSLAVFWHAVVDPLAAFFYLLTILLWTRYLETRRALHWALTFGAYLCALLSKEVAFFLWLLLFLIEWWFYGTRPSLRAFIWQYALFIVALFPYLLLVLNVQGHGEFVGQFGFSIGPHMLGNLIPYLAVLTFPWLTELPNGAIFYVWMAIAVLAYAAVMLYKKSAALLFLALFAVLNISPLLGFPLDYFATRYLYFSMMVSAIVLALLFQVGRNVLGKFRWFAPLTGMLVAALVVVNSAGVASAAADIAEYTRQLRVPFRDISRQHASFPDDSYVYFVYSPKTPLVDLQGLFLTRYGTKLNVSGTEDVRFAGLREHANTFVYYFDDADRPREMVVNRNSATRASLNLPADFNTSVRLEGYELANPTIKRGDPLILFLYWRVTGKLEKDYTVFVHVVDAGGKLLAQNDSQPRKGNAPTSRWKLNQLVVDAVVLPIPVDVSTGSSYRLEVGLYDAETMQRFSIGQLAADKVVIEPIAIQ